MVGREQCWDVEALPLLACLSLFIGMFCRHGHRFLCLFSSWATNILVGQVPLSFLCLDVWW